MCVCVCVLCTNQPATISQDIVIPSLQFVSSADGVQHGLTGLQPQMICIVQTQPTARLLQLFGCQALQRRLRGDRHENRQINGAMRQMERRGTGLGGLNGVKKQVRARTGGICQSSSASAFHFFSSSTSLGGRGVGAYRAAGFEVKGQRGRGRGRGLLRGGGHFRDWSRCIGIGIMIRGRNHPRPRSSSSSSSGEDVRSRFGYLKGPAHMKSGHWECARPVVETRRCTRIEDRGSRKV